MSRTKGARNINYEEHRRLLARRVLARLVEDEGLLSSMRTIAFAAGTSVATLKHYFGDRAGVLKAVMETLHLDSAPHLAGASMPAASGDVQQSLRQFLRGFKQAWFTFGVGRIQASMLAAGLSSSALGATYVMRVLEPLLQSFEVLVRVHMDRGELARADPRLAALSFMSPVVLGLLHQDSLGGSTCRPLDLDVFLENHIEVFLRAFGPRGKGRSQSRNR